ncbi:MAG: T9SS type A sorting domain-containing protein [candidate division KSB1 bacterium]|nr:T9SS type A sorting domain-containing protein [candidate division KSB1 bacterium]MDZ7275289.1 T9SS type A sorting domain-containing protein [candidate division KSB1 bacterium]MDZ7287457.1 T9SS type A sorting domain-containing protein [candidate division KSB1 bacterium]MDZ7299571.1 T9SS type A sorting domain-containing protein [candidate division KSB1 bacterium]MDZ7307323.1 T9SS type A sorting domain-containing protein [candidate division KSB1 bacterium]
MTLASLLLLPFCGGRSLAQTGAPLATTTTAEYKKSNQSKVFYHDGFWWALAFHEVQAAWYLWKYNGTSWSRTNKLEKSTSYLPDVVLNAAQNRLYLFFSHHTQPKLRRYTYSAGTWAIDSGFPKKTFTDFVNADHSNPVSMVQSKNGDLWIFRIDSNRLQAKRSSDAGVSWSNVITIKASLNDPKGTTDAVAFTAAGENYVGVGYGESGSGTRRFGFFRHRDGDPDSVWTDESAQVMPLGSENAQNNVCLAVDGTNNVYMFVRTTGGASADPRNTLYKRNASGIWSAFVVNTVGSGVAWHSPAITIDGENGRLYLFGRNASSSIVEYKTALIGQEHTLTSATIQTALANGTQAFSDLSVPGGLLNSGTDLLITADNTTANDIWFNKLDISAGSAPVVVDEVNVNPPTTAVAGEYTIAFSTSPSGNLAAGSGTITVTWPAGTTVPAAISAAQVTVNGVAASAVTTNPAARQAVVTVAATVPGSSEVSLVFAAAAGIINPATPGSYTLTLATSAQPLSASSPAYNINSPLLVGDVTVTPNYTQAAAGYTIPLTLGSAGALTAGSGTITVRWPAGTAVPAAITASNVLINGVAAAAAGSDSSLRQATITVPQDLTGGGNVAVEFLAPAGLHNPAVTDSFTLEVWTSSEGSAQASPPYAIEAGPAVTVSAVTVSPDSVSEVAAYTIPITLSTGGGLLANHGRITVTWPAGTGLPATINSSAVTINGQPVAAVITDPAQQQATITVAATLAGGSLATVVFDASAGLINPANAGQYTLTVHTSAQVVDGVSPAYEIKSSTGVARPVVGSGDGLARPNQNRVFHHAGSWWLIALNKSDQRWKLWQLVDTTWTVRLELSNSNIDRPDCFLDGANNRLYVLLSHTTQSRFLRLTYGGGGWAIDAGYPANVPGARHSGGNPLCFTRARNGELWVFGIGESALRATYSTNEGLNWSAIFVVKAGLHASTGMVDCLPFTTGGVNYIGVAYGEDAVPGAVYGFLRHQDGHASTTWSDESAQLTSFAGTNADDQVAMAVSDDGTVYLVTKTDGSGSTGVYNGLYKRTPSGSWQSFVVNRGSGWSSPAIALDESNHYVYLIGHDGTHERGVFKKAAYGSESDFENATTVDLFVKAGVDFDHPSLAPHNHTSATGLLAVMENESALENWYNLLALGTPPAGPLTINSVTVSPATAGLTAAYSINLTLGSTGALAGGLGTLTITWPAGTTVPSSMSTAQVTVNGVAAAGVTSEASQRRVTVTVPTTLNGGSSVSLVFALGAGLVNPAAGSYTLQAFSSAQPSPATSPSYNINEPQPVTVNAITVAPTQVAAVAAYTIPVILGSEGALSGGAGTITVTWPEGTIVPAAMAASSVTVNGVAAQAVAADSLQRRAVVTVPASLAGNDTVSLVFTAAAHLINPALSGNYTLQVFTSQQTPPATSPAYTLTDSTPVAIGNVTVNPNRAFAAAAYAIPLTLGVNGGLAGGSGTITVTWPAGTTVPATIAAANVTVNGVAAHAVAADSLQRRVVVTVPATLAGNAGVTLVFAAAAGVTNPAAGSYSLVVFTSAQTNSASSPLYQIIAQPPVVVNAISVTPSYKGEAAAYSIPLTLGPHGGLTGGSGTITVTWPNNTSVPAGINAANVTVNGIAAQAVTSESSQRRATVTVPATLAGSASVTLAFATAANIVNPTTTGNYTLQVTTSKQDSIATSPVYLIEAQPPVAVSAVTVNPNYAGEAAEYTIPLTLGAYGGLTGGSGVITVEWPAGTTVPASMAPAEVKVNGTSASAVSTNPAQRRAMVTVPATLANGASVTLLFTAAAGVINPAAGNHTLSVFTSRQDSPANSPAYAITTQPPVVVGNVTVNPTIAGEVAGYTIPITLGAYGGLTGGSGTITVTWPEGTSVPGSISTGSVTVNGVNAAAVSSNSTTRQATVTVPNTLANNASVNLVFTTAAAILNPGTSGDYSLLVHTSKQTGDAASPGYTIDPSPNPPPSGTGTAIAGTGGDFDKPHQSRVFYHDGKWWLAGLKKSENKWKLWKFDGSNWVDQGLVIADTKTYRPDCFLNSAANKLYIFVSGGTKSQFLRLSYSGGAWSKDAGYPVNITHFTHSGEYSISFSRADNGELWAFRVNSNQLEGIVSTNEGTSWSGVIVLKSGLNNTALTDCHAFASGGNHYMGVCYSENSTTNSIVGFLRHSDGSSSTAWTDESGSLPPYSGTRSDDHINMAVAGNGTVYLITKTDGGGASIVDNGLYKRSPSGTWQLFAVNRGGGWTRPALAIDQSNNFLYAIGAPEGSERRGYYKKAALGSEGDLETASSVTIFEGSNNYFVNPSVAQHNHTSGSGVMIAIENDSEQQLYYNLLNLGPAPPPSPVTVNSVTVNPATTSVTAAYTIGITLGSAGSLGGGAGTITVTWPANTTVPAAIASSAITVNGIAAVNVATNTAGRFAVVTVPANLAANASVTLEVTAAAGIVNPGTPGAYTLQVKTSAQPVQATSPNYNLQAPVPVTVSNITVLPDTVSRVAGYTIPLTLGSQGALTGGSSTITITWPAGTTVPASMAVSSVTVNGVNAANVTTTPATRRAVVTVPNSLAAGASVTVQFAQGAGIVNPAVAGSYTLQVQTSSQPVDATSPSYTLVAPPGGNAGALVHANTMGLFEASNQSKLFHHDGMWWLAAYDRTVNDWYLWKYAGGNWTRNLLIEYNQNSRIDIVPDSPNNRFFGLASLDTGSLFGRVGYNSGTWAVQSSTTLSGFTHDDEPRPLCLVRASNGHLWVFRVNAGSLEARQSTDNGTTWSGTLTLKSGISGNRGMVDAVRFNAGGVNYVGVFYGMLTADGGTAYGFLKHDDNAAAGTWSDESSALTFFGNERAEAGLSAMAAPDGRVYVLTANSNASGADPANTLYVRATGGTWSKFKVNTANGSQQWRSPALAIDASNNRLYVMGIRTTAPARGEYKMCSLGSESTLETQPVSVLFANGSDDFDHLSAPAEPFTNTTGLMVAAANLSADAIWYNQLIGGTAKFGAPAAEVADAPLVEGVQCYPNPFNPETTIRFVLSQNRSVRLQIFNLRGELVRMLVNKDMPAGVHEVRWNGRDKTGRPAASGIYFYRLALDGKVFTGSMQMIK